MDLIAAQSLGPAGEAAEGQERGHRRDLAPAGAALLGAVSVQDPAADQPQGAAVQHRPGQHLGATRLQKGVGIEEDQHIAGGGVRAQIGPAGEPHTAQAAHQPHLRVATGDIV
ncbi:MAG: hypothetical protein U1E24_18620, partial [Phenylobacterium sp.]|nr:hypothetical protein [Phenylobacterium sp.]